MSPRRCSPTTACACCCATSSASPQARPCRASTGVCWATQLRRRLRNLLRLRQQVRARDLAGEIRMVLPHVLLGVLPKLLVVLALHDAATDARDLLHPFIVRRQDLDTTQPLLQNARRHSSSRQSAAVSILAPRPASLEGSTKGSRNT